MTSMIQRDWIEENPQAFEALIRALFIDEMKRALAEQNRIAEDLFLNGTGDPDKMPVGILKLDG